jgi:Tfp pilus assembly protein PilZ
MAQIGRSVQKHRRVSLQVKAQVTTLDAEQDGLTGDRYFRLSEETCANVSNGGAFVATDLPIRKGCRLMLEFELPNGESIEAIGKVVWSRVELPRPVSSDAKAPVKSEPAGVGIEFVGSAPEQVDKLARYLAKSLPRTRSKAPDRAPSQTLTV